MDRISTYIEAVVGSGGFFDNLLPIVSRCLQLNGVGIEQSYQACPSWQLLPDAYNAQVS